MELKTPRAKKHKLKTQPALPVTPEGTIHTFKGHFNGFSVVIKGDNVKKLNSMGCFGKGTLSRGYPLFNQPEIEAQVLRRRVFNRRKEWGASEDKKKIRKVIVVPDSESDNEEYFANLKPEYQVDSSSISEDLNLSLEEAFFLCDRIKCLDIYYNGDLLSQASAWTLFSDSDRYFVQNYIVYHYYRSKNWVVKAGIKFGGDFLLYKEGPSFYHASYVVIIDVLDHSTQHRRLDLCRRSMEVANIVGLNRLCETVGKELLICQLVWPPDLTKLEPIDVSKFLINEVLMRRWVSSQNREQAESYKH